MYENLVKRLRDKANALDYDGWVDTAASLEEAADAIEKLIEVIQNHDFLESLMKPHWIPVTDHLPEKKRESYWCLTDGGFCHEIKWTDENRIYGGSDDWGWYIFDVPLGSHVTHWMPRFKLPKEESHGREV